MAKRWVRLFYKTGYMFKKWGYLLAILIMPIVWFRPKSDITLLILILISVMYVVIIRWKNGLSWLILAPLLITIVWGEMYSNELIKWPLVFNTEQSFFKDTATINYLNTLKRDALYMPYKLRPIVFNNLYFLKIIIGNIFKFLNLNNLAATLSLANLYIIGVGISEGVRNFKKKEYIFSFITILAGFFVIGLKKLPDKSNSLYLFLPVIIFLIISGWKRVNWKIWTGLLLVGVLL